MKALQQLRDFIKHLPPGPIKDERALYNLLRDCWILLEGSTDTNMNFAKLHRVENPVFEPPSKIIFEIERHGQTVAGSVYADLHRWSVDVEKGTAECNEFHKKRVVGVKDAPLKVQPLAEKVFAQITAGDKNSKYLKWVSDNRVRVLIGNLIPETNQWTTNSRRNRFRAVLEPMLEQHGWKSVQAPNTYERST